MFKKVLVGLFIASSVATLSACATAPAPKPTASHVEIVPVKSFDLNEIKDGANITMSMNEVKLIKVDGKTPTDLKVTVADAKVVQYVIGYSNDGGATSDPAFLPVKAGETDVTIVSKEKTVTVHFVVKS